MGRFSAHFGLTFNFTQVKVEGRYAAELTLHLNYPH